MPRSKGLLMLAAFLTLLLIGASCEMSASSEAEPEEQVVAEGKVPQWLLAEHRFEENDEDEEALLPKDDDEAEEPAEEADPELAEEPAETQPAETDPEPEQEETAEPVDSAEEPAQEEEPEKERVSNQEWRGGTYSGDWQDGAPHGRGTFYHPSGAELTGNWVNGNPDGRVRFTDTDGNTDIVIFSQGRRVDDGASDWWSPGGDTGSSWFQ